MAVCDQMIMMKTLVSGGRKWIQAAIQSMPTGHNVANTASGSTCRGIHIARMSY